MDPSTADSATVLISSNLKHVMDKLHSEMFSPSSMTRQTSPFLSLPIEILQLCARNLLARDHAALARTCRYLTYTLRRQLFDCNSGQEHQIFTFGIKQNNIPFIKRTLAYKMPISVNLCLEGGSTPLGLAAKLGHSDMVSYLIHRGAVVNAQGEDGLSSLTHVIDGLVDVFGSPRCSDPSTIGRHLGTMTMGHIVATT